MRAHVIENGVVVNTIEVDSLDVFPEMLLLDAALGGQMGDSWDGQVFTPPAVVAPTIEQRRAQVSAAIDLHAKALRDGVVQLISPAEMSSWPIKQKQAEAFALTSNESDAPMLVKEASFRQCSVAELVAMVLAKADVLSDLEATISGECGRRQDVLRAIDDIELIDALAAGVRFGWPGFPDPAQ